MNMIDQVTSRRKMLTTSLAAGLGLTGIARAQEGAPVPAQPEPLCKQGSSSRCHDEMKALPPDKMLERMFSMIVKAENSARAKDEDEEQFSPFEDGSLKFYVPANQAEMKKTVEKTLREAGLDETDESFKSALADFEEGKKAPSLLIYNVGREPETAKSYFVVNEASVADPLRLLLPLTNYMHSSRMAKSGVEPSPGFQQLASVAAARTVSLLANHIAKDYGAEDSIALRLREMNTEQQQDNWTGIAQLYKHVRALMGMLESQKGKLDELKKKLLKPEPDPKIEGQQQEQQEAPKQEQKAPRIGPADVGRVAQRDGSGALRVFAYDAQLNLVV